MIDELIVKLKIDKESVGIFFIENELLISTNSNDYKLPFSETVESLALDIIDLHLDSGFLIASCATQSASKNISLEDYYACNIKKALLQIRPEDHQQWRPQAHWVN